MRRQRWWLPMLALVFATSWKPTSTLPVRDEELDTSTKLLGSSVVTSVSVVTGSSGSGPGSASNNADRSRVIPSKELPSSPANLLRPDSFQFYTLNKDGSVVTKKMTEREIQSLIAAGGGHSPMDDGKPQNAGDVHTGGMQVTDVLENVQKVLKDEMSKLAPVMTSMPTIPGHPNTEWSSILPAIFGGESEHDMAEESRPTMITNMGDAAVVVNNAPVRIPEVPGAQTSGTRLPTEKPSTTAHYDIKERPPSPTVTQSETEKPMIQVPVITVDQKISVPQEEENSTPVFQMLNTISADKMDAKNNTQTRNESGAVEPQKIDLSGQKETVKPAKITNKPNAQDSDHRQSVNAGVPEMVEISLNQKESTERPESMIITANNISRVPPSQPPAVISVISETHSTSMKVSGQEEVPLREPPKPVVVPADRVESPVVEKKPEVTEKPAVNTVTDVKLDSTTVRTSPSETTAPVESTEIPEKPGFIAQGVSFFENLPQTVSDIVADLIHTNSSNSEPTVEKTETAVPTKTSVDLHKPVEIVESVRKNQTAETTVSETTAAPIKETVTSKKPDREPVYQMIPEIIPDKQTPPAHGSSPSEATSIEHIIGTLNDPAVSASETNVDDQPGAQASSAKPALAAEAETSTAATSINAETSAESSSGKPVEPLPTELADSLSSMISQISDAMTSVLPVGQDAGLDTTGKKNVVDMLAEEPATNETTKSGTEEISKSPVEPAAEIKLPLSDEPQKVEVFDAKLPEIEDPIVAPAHASEITEITKDIRSTTTAPVTTGSASQDGSTAATSDSPSTEKATTEVPVNQIDELETPVLEKLDAVPSIPEHLKPDADSVLASSEIATDSILPAVSIGQLVLGKDTTEAAITDATLAEKMSTGKPDTTVASSATSVVTTAVTDNTEEPPKVQTDRDVATTPTLLAVENQKNFTSMEVGANENNTEMPIVHIAITEAKPTDIVISNKTHGIKNEDNRPESPVVRIQLTDPVTVINNMIESANTNATPGPVVSLILPGTGSVPANSIASGLIAGFPSTTTQAAPEADPTTVDSIKSQPEIQSVTNGSLNDVISASETSDVPTKNITNIKISQTPEIITEIRVTEKNEVAEATTLENVPAVDPEITVPATNSPIEPIAVNEPYSETTTQADLTERTTIANPEKKESVNETAPNKRAELEASATPSVLETEPDIQSSSKVWESVTVISDETTPRIRTPSTATTIENQTKPSAPAIFEQSDSDKKVNEESKIVETTVNTSAKPETTAGPTESSEEKTETPIPAAPEKLAVPKNQTMSEVPVVRIDVASEAEFNNMPSKIQATDLPIVETSVTPIKPMVTEKIQTQASELATTAQIPIDSTANSDVSSPSTTISSVEGTEATIAKDKPKIEDPTKQTVKTDDNEGSDSSEKVAVTSTPIPLLQQTEEVRIRVNDTAVLVTKRPVSETTGQTLGNVQKTTVNQSEVDQPTTPKSSPVTEESLPKDDERVERLPVPVKVSELSSSHDASPINSSIGTETPSSSGSKNHSTLDEIKRNEENTTLMADDPTKPGQEKGGSGPSEAFDTVVSIESSTLSPSTISDEIDRHGGNDSHGKPSTKVEVTTSTNFDESPTASTTSGPTKLENEPAHQSDVKVSVRVTDKPKFTTSKPDPKPINIKKTDAPVEAVEEKWTLIPQQVYPALTKTSAKQPATTMAPPTTVPQAKKNVPSNRRPAVPMDHRPTVSGLDCTVTDLDPNMLSFADLCNELAFTFWTATNESLSQPRSLAVSPFGMTSLLAMVFLGAREPTSSQMNSVLKLDDNNSFNPHLVFHNITEAVRLARNQGVANAAFVRELFVDRSKVPGLMSFYKKQAQQFYDGIVEEAYFDNISELVRRRTNHKMRTLTKGRIDGFMANTDVPLRSPLAAMSANVFQTDCNDSAASSEGRDGELYFAVSPGSRQRKLVPVPATVWKSGVLGGYVTSLDATAVALGGADKLVSTIFVIPGNQGHTAPGDSLDKLEQRFVKGAAHDDGWKNLLKVLIPRPGLELQIPKFSHRSIINATAALKRMGLKELFSTEANLKAIKGVASDVHLADIFQINLFSTCGDETINGKSHHAEIYPNNPERETRGHRDFEEARNEFSNVSADEETIYSDDASQRGARWDRQAEPNTDKGRVKLDRPFLYFVRHNPTGLILHMGRFNPRLPSSNSAEPLVKTTIPIVSPIASFKRDRSKIRD